MELSNRGNTKEMYIQDLAEKCGLIIKVEESWHSEKLVEYSRAYHYEEVQFSNALKKILRINSKANQTMPTFNKNVSGMSSAGSAVYYLTCVETAHHIQRHVFLATTAS